MKTKIKFLIGLPLVISTVILIYTTIVFVTVDFNLYWLTGALALIHIVGIGALSMIPQKIEGKDKPNEEL